MVAAVHAMKSRREHKRFVWQALLIAAPVLILSAIALYSLRLDKASIEQQAREDARVTAQTLARDLARDINEALLDAFNPGSGEKLQASQKIYYGLVAGDQVLFPGDYPRVPVPPEWPSQLSTQQRQLWQAAEDALFQKHDRAACAKTLADIRAGALPEPVAANVELDLLLFDAGRNGGSDASRRLLNLARRYREIETAAGTPLADLALVEALRHSNPESLPDVLSEAWGRLTCYPSFLSTELLAAAEKAQPDFSLHRNKWRRDEEVRDLLRELMRQSRVLPSTGEIWFQKDRQWFLVLCAPGFVRTTQLALFPAEWLGRVLEESLDATPIAIPPYARVRFQIGLRGWQIKDYGEAQDVEPLASASGALNIAWKTRVPQAAVRDHLLKFDPAVLRAAQGSMQSSDLNRDVPIYETIKNPFTVSLVLVDPDSLYARYRQRLWLMAGFIVAAAAAAGIGLAGAWRALQRQLRLAEMTSNFVSSVSHELRAPLASVRLMAESLDQGRAQEIEKQKAYFRLIVQECRRLSSLVENVLDFSRIREGRKTYESEPVDLVELLRNTVELMAPAAAERKVSLDLEEPDAGRDESQPCWDGQAVQQALINLIDNAVKHSPAGATVKIRCESAEKQIRIMVEDQGPGIPEEYRERIFEPFYRRGSELRRETKGIGIGLSIVKHVAEAHGGRAFVEGVPGQGSRFVIELPGAEHGSKQ